MTTFFMNSFSVIFLGKNFFNISGSGNMGDSSQFFGFLAESFSEFGMEQTLGNGYLYAQLGGSVLNQIFPFLLIFLVIYLLIIRPQAKRQQLAEWKKRAVAVGDKIVTSGGMLAKVVGFRDDGKLVVIEITKDVKVEILRAMVFDVLIDLDKKGNRVDGKTPPKVVSAADAKNAKSIFPSKQKKSDKK